MLARDRAFFDTNVLIYQFDRTAPDKQKRAIDLIEQHILEERAVISSQVVQEFMNVATKKFQQAFTFEELRLIMSGVMKPLCRHSPTFDFYERALTLYMSNSLSIYEALIVQAALDLGCKMLYSEDLQAGQSFDSLTVVNPFL